MRPIADMDGRTKFIVMAGTLLGLFTSAMDQTIVATSLPHIVADLGGFGLFSWVGTGFLLASTTTIPIVGKLSDIFGRKPFYMAGIVLLLAGSALCGSAQNIEQLIAFRVIQGFGAGMIMSIAFTLIGDVFPPAERGRWMGLMSAVFAVSSVAGPLIGGGLTDHVHWRWVFYINLPLGGIALAVLALGMPRIRPENTPKIDYRGLVLLCSTTVPLLLAFSWAGDRYDWVSPQVIGFLLWAGVALALFTYFELRTEEPLLPMHLFKNRTFTVSALVTLITGFAMMGSMFYIPLFVQGVLGASATNSGLVTMPMMIGMAVASSASGQIMSRTGRYRVLGVAGLLIMVGGMAMLSTMDAGSTRRDVTYAMIIFGVGLGTAIPLFMLAVQNSVPYRVMGVATSSMQFLRAVGGTMGVAIMFSLIQTHYHSEIEKNVPLAVQENPQLNEVLSDPQFLVNDQALEQVEASFSQFGANGDALFDETLTGVQASLAEGISDAFFIAIFVLAAAVVVGLFLKEEPMRKTHMEPGEDGRPVSVPLEPAEGSLPPLAGGANGDDST
ncbi:MAG TPA: MDR family MFS transporter [Dehalococcoidia bacterium]|nr:MDR family MFS transporter [Dehalococcoidia bacterium]